MKNIGNLFYIELTVIMEVTAGPSGHVV